MQGKPHGVQAAALTLDRTLSVLWRVLGAQLERGGVGSAGGHETNQTVPLLENHMPLWLVRLTGSGVILQTERSQVRIPVTAHACFYPSLPLSLESIKEKN